MNEMVLVAFCLCLVGCLMGGTLVYVMIDVRLGAIERQVKKLAKKKKREVNAVGER